MAGSIVAFVAATLEFIALGIFKAATERMEPLRGTRPIRVLSLALRSPLWMVGMLLVMVGVVLQFVMLALLPLSAANPLSLAPLLVVLLIGLGFFGERLGVREWLSLGLFAVATLLVAVSVRQSASVRTESLPSYLPFFAVTVPSLVVPLIIFSVGDLRATGRHARPIAGVAYGASIGVLVGTAQLAAVGTFNAYRAGIRGAALLAEPYVWVMTLGITFGLGQILIALQRCRLVIVITISAIIAQTQLVLMATLLYGEGWPQNLLWSLLRAAGFGLGIVAVFVFPRHAPDPDQAGPPEVPYAQGARQADSLERQMYGSAPYPPPRPPRRGYRA